jgi:hypothetical protein
MGETMIAVLFVGCGKLLLECEGDTASPGSDAIASMEENGICGRGRKKVAFAENDMGCRH